MLYHIAVMTFAFSSFCLSMIRIYTISPNITPPICPILMPRILSNASAAATSSMKDSMNEYL